MVHLRLKATPGVMPGVAFLSSGRKLRTVVVHTEMYSFTARVEKQTNVCYNKLSEEIKVY